MPIINIDTAIARRVAEVQQFRREWNAAEIQANAARLAFGVALLRQLDQVPSFAQRVRGQS